MKKLIALITLLVLALSLVACAKHDCIGCGKKGGGTHAIKEGGETSYLCDDCNRINNLFTN